MWFLNKRPLLLFLIDEVQCVGLVLRNSGLIVNITRWIMIVLQRDCIKKHKQENALLSQKSNDDESQSFIESEQERINFRSNNAMYFILAIQALLLLIPNIILID